ncbi:nucleotide exchange factor GrpE [Tractidigestivibacter sp.]|uniref:nucleotide exchange factor GrpE n=1 Tax=Tractidigestivibacter sp. TaxID=2847320 RepID=UPI002A92062D|nr:nucleotide exchange factor GrpE [Tractidigestivibacter sp.]MDY5270658.1 nucleotide exchange factor GrpE [Tractidigestivibacter sp.]
MKVPIDNADEKKPGAEQPSEAESSPKDAPAATEGAASAAPSPVPGDIDPEDDAAMRAAAMKAADEVLEQEAAEDAKKFRSERDELQKKLSDMTEDIEKAKKEAAESTDRLVRLQADWDNYRRRTAQERLDERERAAEKLVVSLLPVIDDMERAIEHASGVGQDATSEQFRQFVDGVSAVHDKMVGALSKEGVEPIDPAGDPFDPLEHQAVGRREDKDSYDETVDQVYQKGYRMGRKVIRTAMVTVTYGGPKRPTEDAPVDKAGGSAPGKDGGDEASGSGDDAAKEK